MKTPMTVLVPAFACAALTVSTAGAAQYGAMAPQKTQQLPTSPTNVPARGKANVSKPAMKALVELQAAVNANDVANIPAKLAAAQAVAKSSEEKLLVAQLQLKAAVAANNEGAQGAAIEALIASGGVDQAQIPTLYRALGKLQHKQKQYAQAASSFERALALDPASTDAMVLLAEARNSQGQVNPAIALLQKAIQAKTAAGQKADESWYKRAVALAFNAGLPSSVDLSRQWVAAYPTPGNWRDSLRIYRKLGALDPGATLDTLRLSRATGALDGDTDFYLFAANAEKSSPGEARAVLDEAIAAKQIDPTKPLFKDLIASLKANKALAQSQLPQLTTEARAAPAARFAMRIGDAYYGYGDYTKAAELYRIALAKPGADANLINLHLGMALARAGDKAGAGAALKAVAGSQAELAKFWMVYLATHA
ncbi:MAG: tetratricopeptide repeat protein [Sphingomicrobium sp.]